MQPRVASRSGNALKRRSAEIIAAAAKVFAQRGYHGASTQDIADVLGMRQASLYYYFDSKDAALEAVCASGVEDYAVRAQTILLLADGVSQAEVSRRVGLRRRIVRKWAERFVDRGLLGLEDSPRSGRPPRFSPDRGDTPGQAGVRVA